MQVNVHLDKSEISEALVNYVTEKQGVAARNDALVTMTVTKGDAR